MVVGTIIGVEVGPRIIELLETSGDVDLVIGVTYIMILLVISAFTAWESIRALRMIRTDQMDVKEVIGFKGLAQRTLRIKIWPMVSFRPLG